MQVRSLSWVDRKNGRVIHVENDVLDIIKQIRQFTDRIEVFYNEQSGKFDLVETVNEVTGEQQLVFSVDELDQRVVTRLLGADHWHGHDRPIHVLGDHEDVAAQVDAHNEGIERQRTEDTAGRVGEVGERLAWALDYCTDKSSIGGSISVKKQVK